MFLLDISCTSLYQVDFCMHVILVKNRACPSSVCALVDYIGVGTVFNCVCEHVLSPVIAILEDGRM